ncbi:MAG TPA: sigma-54 dependent transcriptional regulator [Bryobacteraceae bacterium]|nr:sigma-54 dependent transcriptional regulator [Bryobacteraceae bacterium]
MPRILWLRSNDRFEEVQALERETGLRIAVSNGDVASRRAAMHRVQVVLIELPLAATVIQETLQEAQSSATPLPVIIYDPVSELDESLLQRPVSVFRHVTERYTAAQLSTIVGLAIEHAGGLISGSPEREPWRELLIGESRAMCDLHALIRLVSPRQSTVLITGETGTGKEMVARAIHMASKRSAGRMVAVNCAAIPENLVEAELFGHAKGGFTGAINDRPGRFEQAHRGTIFLDEVGEIPLAMQPKLLRVLQERELQRVGGSGTIQIDTRVIAASNIDLETAAAEKRFREDLLYRLNVVPISVPALRERISDIPLLAEHFVEKVCRREELSPKRLSADAINRLMDYDWPGNVRQLEHAIEMAVTLSGEREQLFLGDIRLPDAREIPMTAPTGEQRINLRGSGINFDEVIGGVEKLLLQEALRKYNGNKAKAANFLGLPRTTLMYKIKAYETSAA